MKHDGRIILALVTVWVVIVIGGTGYLEYKQEQKEQAIVKVHVDRMIAYISKLPVMGG